MSGNDIINVSNLRPLVLSWLSSWHAQQPIPLPFGRYDSAGTSITTTGAIYLASVPRALTVVTWTQAFKVATTNNSSNYWTISLIRRIAAGTDITLATLESATLTADAWYNLSLTVNGSVLATDTLIYINVTKNGSPGALSIAGPNILVR